MSADLFPPSLIITLCGHSHARARQKRAMRAGIWLGGKTFFYLLRIIMHLILIDAK
jgi:hypothetical protein